MDQWRRASTALARLRALELARLSAADALAAANALLALGANIPVAGERIAWSGLIELQRSLHRGR
jgi:hypothetical protein